MSKDKEFKPVSHYERCHNSDYSSVQYVAKYNRPYKVHSREQVTKDGYITSTMTYKTINPRDNFDGLDSRDFALENIIAVGAVDSLKEGYMHVDNRADLSDSLEGSIDNLISAVDYEESVNNLNDGGE